MYFVRQRDSQIVYLWDGALLERKAVRHPQLHSFRGGRAEGIPFQLYLEVSPAEVDIGQFKVRESDQDQVIATLKESIYFEPALVAPQMKEYPFLAIAGFDAAVGNLDKVDPVFFEFN